MIPRADIRRKALAVVITFVVALLLALGAMAILPVIFGDRVELFAPVAVFAFSMAFLAAGMAGVIASMSYGQQAEALLGNDATLRKRIRRHVLRNRGALEAGEVPVAVRWASVMTVYIAFQVVWTVLNFVGITLSTLTTSRAGATIGTLFTVIIGFLVVVGLVVVVLLARQLSRARAFVAEHRELLPVIG